MCAKIPIYIQLVLFIIGGGEGFCPRPHSIISVPSYSRHRNTAQYQQQQQEQSENVPV
jgi:hypothetical protein